MKHFQLSHGRTINQFYHSLLKPQIRSQQQDLASHTCAKAN